MDTDKQELQRLAAEMRGHVIHRACELEMFLDIYIAQHFTVTDDKMGELMTLIFTPRITLENKRLIFKFLVENYNPEFIKTYPQFHSHLGKIVEQRNIFAHYPINTTSEAIEKFKTHKWVHFMKFKNTLQSLAYSEETVKKLIDLIYDYTEAIQRLTQINDTTSPSN